MRNPNTHILYIAPTPRALLDSNWKMTMDFVTSIDTHRTIGSVMATGAEIRIGVVSSRSGWTVWINLHVYSPTVKVADQIDYSNLIVGNQYRTKSFNLKLCWNNSIISRKVIYSSEMRDFKP